VHFSPAKQLTLAIHGYFSVPFDCREAWSLISIDNQGFSKTDIARLHNRYGQGEP
jgi:hypothetical protein